jgi:hypothetical protein
MTERRKLLLRLHSLAHDSKEMLMFSLTRVCWLSSFVFLSACGGGGGTDNTPAPPAPVASLTLDKNAVNLTSANSIEPVVASYQGDGLVVGTLPGMILPSWLLISGPTTGANPATVNISAFGTLSPGRYSSTVRFSTGRSGGNTVVRDLPVTYTVDHVLTPTKVQTATVIGVSGTPLSSTLNLTTAGATWEATSSQSWLTVSPASGTGSAVLTLSSNTPLAVGNYTATITVRDTLTNRTRTTAVDVVVNPRRLEVLPRGVALTSTAGSSMLSKTVKVIDTANLGGRWTVSDDAAWLQTTSSVSTGSLTLTADAAGLASGVHYATVTVAPDAEPGLTNTREVKVGFYVDHTSPASPDAIVTGNILGSGPIIADPIRPYAYVAQTTFDDTTSTFNGALLVYNFYTGQLIDSLPFPGRILTGLAASPDGGMLILSDSANSVVTTDRFLIPITLNGSTRSVGMQWPGVILGLQFSHFTVAEISGTPVVLTGNKQIVSMANGAILGNFESDAVGAFVFTGKLAVTPDGGAAMLFGTTSGNHRIARYRLSNISGAIRALETHNMNETGNGADVAVDATGTEFITLANTNGQTMRFYDTSNLTLVNGATVSVSDFANLDVAANGDIYVTSLHGDFVQHDANGLQLGSRAFGQSDNIQFGRVSADGLRTIVSSAGTSGVADVHLNFFSSQL